MNRATPYAGNSGGAMPSTRIQRLWLSTPSRLPDMRERCLCRLWSTAAKTTITLEKPPSDSPLVGRDW